MDVKTVCLGMLSAHEACGYDLKKSFESLFKHFYPAGYGSIYPALADLADAGLVECEQITQEGKPDRKVYRITPAGRDAFNEALNRMTPSHKMRSEFLAMMYFADNMDQTRIETLLDQRIEEFADTIQHIRSIRSDWGSEGDPAPGARFVAGFGEAIARAAADYIRSNRHLLADEAHEHERHERLAAV